MQVFLVLLRRFLPTTHVRAAVALVAAGVAGLIIVVVTVSAFTPTPRQNADAALGSFDRRSYFSINTGDLRAGDLERLRQSGPDENVGIYLDSTQLRPDDLTEIFVQASIPNVRFVEGPEVRNLLRGRYVLSSGRWPTDSRDVVVSRELADKLNEKSFTVLSGRVRLKIVGLVEDTFNKAGDLMIAGPGTWASLPVPPADRTYQPTQAEIFVLADGAKGLDQFRESAQTVLQPDAQKNLDDLAQNTTTRTEMLRQESPPFGSNRLLVSYGPLLLIVALLSAVAAARARTSHRLVRAQLAILGIRRGIWPYALAATAWSLTLGVGFGAAAGLLTAWMLHARLLPVFANQLLRPFAVPVELISVAALTCAAVLFTGLLWPGSDASESSAGVEASSTQGQARLLRRTTAVILAIGAGWIGAGTPSAAAAYLAIASAALAGPDALILTVRLLPINGPRLVVVKAMMSAHQIRQGVAVVVLACCVALPIFGATQLVSTKASDQALAYGRIPSGQIWIQSDGAGDAAGAARAVSSVAALPAPVVIRASAFSPDPNDPESAATFFERVPKGSGNYSMSMAIVHSVDDARRIIGDPFTAASAAALERGGVVDLTGARGQQRLLVVTADGDTKLRTPPLPTASLDVSRQLRAQIGGIVLRSTAQDLGLPINPPSRFVYNGVTPRMIGEAAQAAVAAGYDSEFVQYSVQPPEPTLPIYAWAFVAALTAVNFAVVQIVVRDLARRLRDRGSMLLALGLLPRWITTVALIQAGLITLVGTAAGIVGGGIGIVLSSGVFVRTLVPFDAIAVGVIVVLVFAALGTAVSVRRLVPSVGPS